MRSYSSSERRLNSRTSRSSTPRASGEGSRRSMSWIAFWTRNMLVDSSGSRKPLARPMRDAVALPRLHAATGAKLQQTRFAQRLAVEPASKRGARFVFADELGRKHVAVAGAVLQRNAPDPAALLRRGSRVRREVGRCVRRARPRRGRRAARESSLPRERLTCRPAAANGTRCSRRRSRRRSVDRTSASATGYRPVSLSSATSTTCPSMRVTPRAVAQSRRNSA